MQGKESGHGILSNVEHSLPHSAHSRVALSATGASVKISLAATQLYLTEGEAANGSKKNKIKHTAKGHLSDFGAFHNIPTNTSERSRKL